MHTYKCVNNNRPVAHIHRITEIESAGINSCSQKSNKHITNKSFQFAASLEQLLTTLYT